MLRIFSDNKKGLATKGSHGFLGLERKRAAFWYTATEYNSLAISCGYMYKKERPQVVRKGVNGFKRDKSQELLEINGIQMTKTLCFLIKFTKS